MAPGRCLARAAEGYPGKRQPRCSFRCRIPKNAGGFLTCRRTLSGDRQRPDELVQRSEALIEDRKRRLKPRGSQVDAKGAQRPHGYPPSHRPATSVTVPSEAFVQPAPDLWTSSRTKEQHAESAPLSTQPSATPGEQITRPSMIRGSHLYVETLRGCQQSSTGGQWSADVCSPLVHLLCLPPSQICCCLASHRCCSGLHHAMLLGAHTSTIFDEPNCRKIPQLAITDTIAEGAVQRHVQKLPQTEVSKAPKCCK